MDASRFDAVSRFFAQRRLSRREAVIDGGTALAVTGLAATGLARSANAQDATPAAAEDVDPRDTAMLFVQTFQAGAIAPKAGANGRYTLTLEAGTGGGTSAISNLRPLATAGVKSGSVGHSPQPFASNSRKKDDIARPPLARDGRFAPVC